MELVFNSQPILETSELQLLPLQIEDFEALYKVASDPEIWKQHPNKDRWKKEVFAVFFDGAIKSGGAFKIVEKKAKKLLEVHVSTILTLRRVLYLSGIPFMRFLLGNRS